MPYFVVERDLPGVTIDGIAGAGIRIKTCVSEMSGEGLPIRWVRSFFLPQTQQTHCYFEAASQQVVEEVNQRAQIPYTRIVEVKEMTPDMV